jgi:hypothetical protein
MVCGAVNTQWKYTQVLGHTDYSVVYTDKALSGLEVI